MLKKRQVWGKKIRAEGGEMHQTAAVCLQAARKMLLIEEYSSCERCRGTEAASVVISRRRKTLSGPLYLHTLFKGLKCQSWAMGILRCKFS